MPKIPLQKPLPDFESLQRVLRGEKQPTRVHFEVLKTSVLASLQRGGEFVVEDNNFF